MEIFESDDKITFDISKTIDANELAERWGVTKKSIDNRRQRGQGPNYFKIGGKIRYDLKDVVRMEQESYRSINGSRITKS
jgi:predicted DNA-binding transcriptional regulator AlpA|tara:strand:+ start:230 stop:469 length:240 start_codon:yes stop_codon:yes gene_type:complete